MCAPSFDLKLFTVIAFTTYIYYIPFLQSSSGPPLLTSWTPYIIGLNHHFFCSILSHRNLFNFYPYFSPLSSTTITSIHLVHRCFNQCQTLAICRDHISPLLLFPVHVYYYPPQSNTYLSLRLFFPNSMTQHFGLFKLIDHVLHHSNVLLISS